MPNAPITRYALQGRVVTMNDNFKIVKSGVVYMDGNRIKEVRRATQPAPIGFENIPVVQTNGTIFPGLIELHNHLSYNILPLWEVPRKFDRRSQWSKHPDKTRLITGPMQVLGRSRGFPEAIVRYVEAKCLLAGVTTSQGITLSGVGINKFYQGIVRNVDQPDDPKLPKANTRVQDVDARDIQAFFNRLQNSTCLLLHMSEGVDDLSRDIFNMLRLPNGEWAITEALAGIHCAALRREHFDILRAHGGSMVWSPLSNLLLYGQTADIKAAKDAGVAITLGSDWSPSGSKNLLGELKAAQLVSQQFGGVVTSRELVEMVTINPARILKWQDVLGSLQAEKLADVIVLAGAQTDPYEQLIAATERSISLVVIDGVPRYGLPQLMAPFDLDTEEIKVRGQSRVLNLHDEKSNLDIRGLSLAAARDRIQDGLRRLPELALDLENAVAMGSAIGTDPKTNESFPTLVLDEDELQTESLRPLFGSGQVGDLEELLQLLAGVRYSDLLQDVDVELDPLTVVDDPQFFPRIAVQVNLNDFAFDFKQGLANFYGAQLPVPDGGDFIRRMDPPVRSQFWTARELSAFKSLDGYLSLEDRQLIVQQALVLLEQTYVHLPFKRAMYAIDPIQALKLLQYRLEQQRYELETDSKRQITPESTFHREMISIFTSLRDLHTNYLLPEPYRGKVAFLPFLIEEYYELQDGKQERKYLVSKIFRDVDSKGFLEGRVDSESFIEGVEVLYWNGIPIQRAIELNGELQPGGNLDARFVRGLESLTKRPLARSLPPDEEWVTLRYQGKDKKEHELTQKWLVFSPGDSPSGVNADGGELPATALGFDLQTDTINAAKKLLYAPEAVQAEKMFLATGKMPALRHNTYGNLIPSTMPTVFRAKLETNGLGDFGYIRIFTFNVVDDNAFVDEFVRLVQKLLDQAKNWRGLIIDVRNNGGGSIYAAECLLQALTNKRIEPEQAQFINTPLILQICREHADSRIFPGLKLDNWIESISQSVQTAATYSRSFSITSPKMLKNIRKKYSGRIPKPMILITDALCYSATDMFAAGFQDHRIGKILGTSGNTGAGGANVWTHTLLDRLLYEPGAPLERMPMSPFRSLPFGAGMRVAIRRTLRVGNRAGVPVEDLGVAPERHYCLTKDDLLKGNRGLIGKACEILVE